jgi:SAM-dependent methyltransferase
MKGDGENVVQHFTARAERYDRSSSWCTDDALLDLIFDSAEVSPKSRVLDIACGTGLVSARFKGRVAEVVGLDLTPAMAEQARERLDTFVAGSAHELPFADDSFDAVVCRQGIQFMELERVLPEMVRVLRPGGRLVTADLHAYNHLDRAEYFEVLRLRNPARRNFFVSGDLLGPLFEAGCTQVNALPYVSIEDVNAWSDNGAIDESRREAIRDIYRNGSEPFLSRHHAEVNAEAGLDRIVDHMLFHVTVGLK